MLFESRNQIAQFFFGDIWINGFIILQVLKKND